MKIGIFLEEKKSDNSFENCSYLCKNKDIIYSVVEYSNNPNYLNGYLITRNSNLVPIHESNILGKGPCHVALDKLRNLLYISNYSDGSLDVFSLNSSGIVNKLIYHKNYCNDSHIHYVALSEDNKFLFTIDLGKNILFAYEIIFKDTSFELEEIYTYKFPDSSGPRHLAINGSNIFAITEKSCELYHLTFSKKVGFSLINRVSILPSNIQKDENTTGCAIKLSIDNKFIYVTVRGNNSISVFDSSLRLIQSISCFGETPRDINFDNSQTLLFCANQNSSNISVFDRNKKTGHLLFKSKYPIESPACIIL